MVVNEKTKVALDNVCRLLIILDQRIIIQMEKCVQPAIENDLWI